MLALPWRVVAYLYVFHLAFAKVEVLFVNWYGECERTVGGVDGASVADGLLDEVFVLLYGCWFV